MMFYGEAQHSIFNGDAPIQNNAVSQTSHDLLDEGDHIEPGPCDRTVAIAPLPPGGYPLAKIL